MLTHINAGLFTIASTPAVFQRMIHKYYRVCAYIDNILVKNTTGCVHTSIIYYSHISLQRISKCSTFIVIEPVIDNNFILISIYVAIEQVQRFKNVCIYGSDGTSGYIFSILSIQVLREARILLLQVSIIICSC